MQFWFNRYNPFRFIWDPRLVFTGTTILGVDPETGGPAQHCQACRLVGHVLGALVSLLSFTTCYVCTSGQWYGVNCQMCKIQHPDMITCLCRKV